MYVLWESMMTILSPQDTLRRMTDTLKQQQGKNAVKWIEWQKDYLISKQNKG